MAIIGLSNMYYAIMTAQDTATTAPTYDTPKRLVGAVTFSISPENETATLYGDNMALATVSQTKQRTNSLEIARLPLEDRAALLGLSYDSVTKTVNVNGDAVAPYVAIMYQIDTDENKKWYRVFYKGKFSPAQEDNSTRGESLDFGLHSLEGTFVSRIDNNMVETIKELDATDTTTIASWFTSLVTA